METPMAKIGVNVFVFNTENKVLFGKRLGKFAGMWSLPGGRFEFGEHLSAAATRELQEETGLVATDLEFIQLLNDPRAETHYVHINFLAKSWTGEVSLMETEKFSDWAWFGLDELPESIFGGHTQFFDAYKNKIRYID